MFSGTFDPKVDPKGRVSIPSEFRTVLLAGGPADDKGRPVLHLGVGTAEAGYLEGFSTQEIEALRADIRQLKRGSPRRAQLEYFYFANTSPAQIDENGRISIPQALRDQLGLGEDARFVGYGERFEIWNRDTYTEVRGKSISGLIKAHGPGYSPFALFEEADEERA